MATQEIRNFRPELKDFIAAGYGWTVDLTGKVEESKIESFCGNCEGHTSTNECTTVGNNDQARYVAREWCGWARVNGQRGEMTENGFIPSNRQPRK